MSAVDVRLHAHWRVIIAFATVATLALTFQAWRTGSLVASAGAVLGGALALVGLWRERPPRSS